jgi:hypothetical protein
LDYDTQLDAETNAVEREIKPEEPEPVYDTNAPIYLKITRPLAAGKDKNSHHLHLREIQVKRIIHFNFVHISSGGRRNRSRSLPERLGEQVKILSPIREKNEDSFRSSWFSFDKPVRPVVAHFK